MYSRTWSICNSCYDGEWTGWEWRRCVRSVRSLCLSPVMQWWFVISGNVDSADCCTDEYINALKCLMEISDCWYNTGQLKVNGKLSGKITIKRNVITWQFALNLQPIIRNGQIQTQHVEWVPWLILCSTATRGDTILLPLITKYFPQSRVFISVL